MAVQSKFNSIISGAEPFTGDLNMTHHYIVESDFCHWISFAMAAGATDVTINMVPPGVLEQDRHYHRITFAVDEAPGGEKTCSASLSDGTNTMTVVLTGGETSGWTATNEFDWDASAETLILTYSQDGGGAATVGFMTIKYHYKATPP